jgi:hypothetical protein
LFKRNSICSGVSVDVDQHVDAVAQVVDDGLPHGSVVVVVDAGILEKVVRCDAPLELGRFHEVVVLAVDFSRAGWPCRAGDRVDRVGCLAQRTADRGLARTGRSGNDEKYAEALHWKS